MPSYQVGIPEKAFSLLLVSDGLLSVKGAGPLPKWRPKTVFMTEYVQEPLPSIRHKDGRLWHT